MLNADPRAPGLLLGDRVQLDASVSFGANVIVHAGTSIEQACVIEDNVVLGKPPRLATLSTARGEFTTLRVDRCVTVCSGAIVFAGATLREGSLIGDQAFVRERSVLGADSVLGRGSVIDNDVSIGARVRVQTNVYLTAFTTVEDDVFVGPGVVTTNDDTMGRHERGERLRGATLRRACRIGGAAVLTPGIEIGEEAFVAAGAVVTHDVPPRTVVMGAPARVVRDVPEADLLERWR